jgi:hypothetical protein
MNIRDQIAIILFKFSTTTSNRVCIYWILFRLLVVQFLKKKCLIKGQEGNFWKKNASEIDTLGEQYDFSSIMHYANNTFSNSESLPTIAVKDRYSTIHIEEMGQRNNLSKIDVVQTNKLYKCNSGYNAVYVQRFLPKSNFFCESNQNVDRSLNRKIFFWKEQIQPNLNCALLHAYNFGNILLIQTELELCRTFGSISRKKFDS